jgi:hypothetical protein
VDQCHTAHHGHHMKSLTTELRTPKWEASIPVVQPGLCLMQCVWTLITVGANTEIISGSHIFCSSWHWSCPCASHQGNNSFLTLPIDGMGGQLHVPATLCRPGRSLQHLMNRRRGRTQSQSGCFWRRENSIAPAGIWILISQLSRQYTSHCINWAILAPVVSARTGTINCAVVSDSGQGHTDFKWMCASRCQNMWSCDKSYSFLGRNVCIIAHTWHFYYKHFY